VPKIVVVGLEWVSWAAGALVVWLLTLSSVSGADLAIASACAAITATATVAARRVLRLDMKPSARPLRWLAPLPVAAVQDTAAVLALPWRRRFRRQREGRWQRVPVAPGDAPQPAALRATATLFVSFTPSSVVVDDDAATGELLTHVLVRSPVSMSKAVRR
jgi:hypothetical protein